MRIAKRSRGYAPGIEDHDRPGGSVRKYLKKIAVPTIYNSRDRSRSASGKGC